MDFVALDVETANFDRSSICQLGIVEFRSGVAELCWESLVDPEDLFHPRMIEIHGIEAETVREAPTWPEVYDDVSSLIGGRIVVAHSTFDSSAVAGACARYGLPQIGCGWVDSMRLAQYVWPDLGPRGYSLGSLAARMGINFEHHDAAEDARAAGIVVLRAIEATGLSLAEWLVRVERPIAARKAAPPRP